MPRSVVRWLTALFLAALIVESFDPVWPTAVGPDTAFAALTGADFIRGAFPAEVGQALATALGDVNGDGHLDMVVGNIGLNKLYLNNGSAAPFNGVTGIVIGTESYGSEGVALGDVNGDGHLDLVVGNYNRQNTLYLNNGTANPFAGVSAQNLGDTDSTTAIVLGDLNGDGRLDLIVGNQTNANLVYLNNSSATTPFAAGSTPLLGGTLDTRALELGDVNGDGRLDLIAGNNAGVNLLYVNNGTATPFAGVTGAPIGSEAQNTRSLALGDVNNDGRLDLVVGNNGQTNTLYLNNPANNTNPFAGVTGTQIGPDQLLTQGIALGDVNGDGWLDVIAANLDPPLRLYLNDQATTPFSTLQGGSTISGDSVQATDLALGDLNRDGTLDLAVAINDAAPRVYFDNRAAAPFGFVPRDLVSAASQASPADTDRTAAIALGDINGDGRLDVLAGNQNASNKLYLNKLSADPFANDLPRTESIRFTDEIAIPIGSDSDNTRAIAVGDLNNDGRLDVIAGNLGVNKLYLNSGTAPFFANAPGLPISTDADDTRAIALGDLNGDGWLDLVVGNYTQPNKIYFNNRTANPFAGVTGVNFTALEDRTFAVAIGDVNGDGALDVVFGNDGQQNLLYLNNRTATPFAGVVGSAIGLDADVTNAIAVGDVNGDGALDVIAGNAIQTTKLYLNNRTATPFTNVNGRTIGAIAETTSLALGDLNGDNRLDLILGNGVRSVVHVNNGTIDPFGDAEGSRIGFVDARTSGIAVGDLNGDGRLDIVTGNTIGQLTGPGEENAFFLQPRPMRRLPNNPPFLTVVRPGGATPIGTHNAPLFSAGRLISETQVINIPFRLFDPDGDPASVRAEYSLNGGGTWRTALPSSGTNLTDLPAAAGGTAHTFPWDLLRSGVTGQSDQVVVRFFALPSRRSRANGLPGPSQSSFISASTFPFRIRGTQPRVVDSANNPIAGATVFKLPTSLETSAPPLTNANTGQSWRTNYQGYLAGSSAIAPGDRLVALREIGRQGKLSFYHTSAAPNAQDLAAVPVSAFGVQTLQVSPNNPLMLIDLDVSLEWDARADTVFMARLEGDLRRASRSLYDWSDGQIALGTITIYQNKERWYDVYNAQGVLTTRAADVRIYATNRMRPSASQGGIVAVVTPDRDRPETLRYEPGEVRIGAIWNRNGNPTPGANSRDWAFALAHEIGHYALYLDDNYLGLNAGRLVTTPGCRGAMYDPYELPQSEFHPTAGWLPACALTLSNQSTGRSDWATILRYYNSAVPGFTLNEPGSYNANPGPTGLTLGVTRFVRPVPAQAGVPGREIQVLDPIGNTYRPTGTVRAFALGANNAGLLDLGRPIDAGSLLARSGGARVCVFDLDQATPSLGCATGDALTLTMQPRIGWRPDLQLTAVTSRTLTIAVPADSVGLPKPQQLEAVLFPNDSTLAPIVQSIPQTADGAAYRGTLTATEPVVEGYLLVRVPGDSTPVREAVTDYAIGGSPAPRRRTSTRNRRRAPLVSTDGQVILYTDGITFAASGQFFSIQTATHLPADPPIAEPISQGYRLIGDDAAIQILRAGNASINISYATSDLGDLDAATTFIYYYPEGGTAWQRLADTVRDPVNNEVSAAIVGRGLYAVMASDLWDLSTPGLRLNRTYPGVTAPLPDALTPLTGGFIYIYGRTSSDSADPWKVYAPGAPAWVNDLRQLVTNQRYHIMVVGPLTAPVKPVRPEPTVAAELAQALPDPPALVYSTLMARGGFTPQAGQTVTARFGEVVCGTTTTRLVEGKVVFALDVLSRDERAGCGRLGDPYTLTIGSYTWPGAVPWSNETITAIGIRQVYLPLVRR